MSNTNPRAIPAAGPPPQTEGARRGSPGAAAEASAASKVVPLFTGSDIPVDDPPAIDWPSAIELIRDVAARVRRARDFANEVTRHSQLIIQRSVKQTEDAERRTETAEAAARTALVRAERAEELARLSEARAKLAEKQAETAQAAEAEARLWLRRIQISLRDEFKDFDTDLM